MHPPVPWWGFGGGVRSWRWGGQRRVRGDCRRPAISLGERRVTAVRERYSAQPHGGGQVAAPGAGGHPRPGKLGRQVWVLALSRPQEDETRPEAGRPRLQH